MSVSRKVTTPVGNDPMMRVVAGPGAGAADGRGEGGVVREHTRFELDERGAGLDPELSCEYRAAPRAAAASASACSPQRSRATISSSQNGSCSGWLDTSCSSSGPRVTMVAVIEQHVRAELLREHVHPRPLPSEVVGPGEAGELVEGRPAPQREGVDERDQAGVRVEFDARGCDAASNRVESNASAAISSRYPPDRCTRLASPSGAVPKSLRSCDT